MKPGSLRAGLPNVSHDMTCWETVVVCLARGGEEMRLHSLESINPSGGLTSPHTGSPRCLLQDKDRVSTLCPGPGTAADTEPVPRQCWLREGGGLTHAVAFAGVGEEGRGVSSSGDWLLKMLGTILRDLKQSRCGGKYNERF